MKFLDDILEEEEIERLFNILYGNEFEFKKIILSTGAGISRIMQHIRGVGDKEKVPFIIITAFKYGLSLNENRKRNVQLYRYLYEKESLGVIKIDGVWIEKQEDGKITKSVEEFFFVPGTGKTFNEIKELAKELCKKYEQTAVIYGNDEEIFLYYASSNVEELIGNRVSVSLKDIENSLSEKLEVGEGTGYSEVKNRVFRIIAEYKPMVKGFMSGMSLKTFKLL